MLTLLMSLLVAAAPDAHAGGVGVVTTGGFRGQKVYFYDESDNLARYTLGETLMDYGFGMEFILGDRDDKLQGYFRTYWLGESPEKDPAQITRLVAPDAVVASWREQSRNLGIMTVGLQVEALGQRDTLQLLLQADLGAGILTTDHTEFLQLDLGAGVLHGFGRDIDGYVTFNYSPRYDRGFIHGANAYVGARYLFD